MGADFFSNAANNMVALELSLASSVYGPAWTFKDLAYGEVLTGKQITASAVLGFQSLRPVPEPRA